MTQKQAESASQIDMNVKDEHMKIYLTLLVTKKCKLKLQRDISMHLSRVTSITRDKIGPSSIFFFGM